MAQVYPFPAYRSTARALRLPRADAALRQDFASRAGEILRRGPAQPDRGRERARASRRCAGAQRLYAGCRSAGELDSRSRGGEGFRAIVLRVHAGVHRAGNRGAAHAAGIHRRGQLEEYSAGVVFRHEHTLSGPKADRLELLRHTRTHTGQLFMLYSDEQRRVDNILADVEASAPPATELHDEYGVVHRLWVVSDPAKIAAIQEAMASQKLVIADGHHRYETALTYRNERRNERQNERGAAAGQGSSPSQGQDHSSAPGQQDLLSLGESNPDAPYERAMMTFVNTRSEGLTILPTHRVVANVPDFSWPIMRRYLEPWFTAEEFPFANDDGKAEARARFLRRLAEARDSRAIGVYPAETGKRAYYVLTLRAGANLGQLAAGCFAAAAGTGRGVAARRNSGAGAGDHAASGYRGEEPDLRARGCGGTGCGRSRRGAGGLPAEPVRCRAGDAYRDVRRGDAAEVHGFLSEAAERDHHVPGGLLGPRSRQSTVYS